MGFSKIGYQAFKLLGHRRLHELATMWEERYKGVGTNRADRARAHRRVDVRDLDHELLPRASRIARHGFQVGLTYHLLDNYERFSEIWARHGIEISERRVRRVVDHFEAEEEQVGAWRKILEGTTGALLRQSGSAG